MAIAFRSVGTVSKNSGSGNMTPGLGTGHATDDIHELWVVSADNVSSSVSGWSQKLALNNGTACRLELWWIRDNGSLSAPTVTHTGGNSAQAWIEAYSGVDPALGDPFRDAQLQANSGTTATTPGLTGVLSGDMVTAGFAAGISGFTDGDPGAFSPVATFTETVDTWNPNGSSESGGASDRLLSAAGTSVSSTITWSGSGSVVNIGALVALSSGAPVPGPVLRFVRSTMRSGGR